MCWEKDYLCQEPQSLTQSIQTLFYGFLLGTGPILSGRCFALRETHQTLGIPRMGKRMFVFLFERILFHFAFKKIR